MAMALYEPGLGYYRTSDDRATRAGDFLTAPETHPIFGAAIARQLDEVHRRLGAPGRFVVRDYGAGSGALGLSILEAVTGRGVLGRVAGSTDLAAALVYVPIEVDRERRDAIVGRLTAAGFDPASSRTSRPTVGRAARRWRTSCSMPCRSIAWSGGRTASASWRSAGRPAGSSKSRSRRRPRRSRLGWPRTAWSWRTLPGPRSASSSITGSASWRQVSNAGSDSSSTTATRPPRLYGPERSGGTLRAYAGQRVHDDWSIAVGRQDLTAHVDFSAVARAAVEHGLTDLGLTSQAEFLVGLGLDSLLDAIRSDPATTIDEWLAVRSAVRRLLDPRALGGFKVAVLGRGLAAEPVLAGLSFHLPG